MNNQQRNEPCHCGSGKKYKNCCMRKDEAQAQLSKQEYDVRNVIGPRTSPYVFWKRWSVACRRNEFGLVRDMLLPDGPIANKINASENFFESLTEVGLPYEGRWNLDKIKLGGTTCMFLCHRTDSEDKNADVVCSMMKLRLTNLGLRVEDIQKVVAKPEANFHLAFDLFGVHSVEGDYLKKLDTGWTRPDLTDASSRYVAPQA